MVVGYNHNIKYKGEVFHIQTEDSGINNPHIITLLYRGGNIIASKKTSYADIVKMGNLSQIVEELMKEQHKDMLRRLKSSEFDTRLGLESVVAAMPDSAPPIASAPEPASAPAPQPPLVQEAQSPPPVPRIEESPRQKQSLDDIIFEFLSAGDEKK